MSAGPGIRTDGETAGHTGRMPEPPDDGQYSVSFRLYTVALVAVTVLVVAAGIRDAEVGPLGAVLWIALISGANLLVIPISPKLRIEATLGEPVIVAAAVLLGPAMAALVTGLSVISERELHRDRPVWLIVFNRAQSAVSAAAASAAAMWLYRSPGDTLWLAVATFAAVVVYQVVNTAAVTAYLWTRGRLGLTAAAKGSTVPYPRFAVDFATVGLLALLIVIAYDRAGVLAVVLAALPLWLGFSALRSARESEDRAEELQDRVRELETLNLLGGELLTAHREDQVEALGFAALHAALDTDAVVVSLAGDVGPELHPVKVPGADLAVVGVPTGTSKRSMAVAEAISGLLGMALQRLELEQELGEVQRARAALSGRILEEATRERSRIALEIHDDVLPYLAAAEIQADNVRSAIKVLDADRADQLASATRHAVHDGIARLRDVLEALRSQIVVPGGLRGGLEEALHELEIRHGVEGLLDASEALSDMPHAVEILMMETARGCLANVARHAKATKVEVVVEATEAAVAMAVRDDGRGFDPGCVPEGHHGLALMQQRVELARGRFAVDSRAGGGTTVQVEVPL